jgi:predicted metalloendopeptidase
VFSGSYPDAFNFGGIGMFIGHEFTHGFDNSGARYDGKGMIKDWWGEQPKKQFSERSQCMVKKFDTMEYYGKKVNGTVTLAENIADDGGAQAAFNALTTYMAGKSFENITLGGIELTPEQVYFIGTGQAFCGKNLPELTDIYLQDLHAPSVARVNGIATNNPKFSEVFKCPKGSKMNPEKRCVVWKV